MTEECKECGKGFIPNRPFQVFCDSRCKGVYWRRRYRQQAVEEAEDRLAVNGNGHGTPEERQQAKEVLSRIVREQRPRFLRRI